MVYTITSGFYPQLFTGKDTPKFNFGKGKGRKGMQWMPKGGFSKGSLRKVQGKPKLQEAWVGEFFGKLGSVRKDGSVVSWDEAYAGLESEQKIEIDAATKRENISDKDMGKQLSKSRFLGNNDTYQLWGTRVWYQEGQRAHIDEETNTDIGLWQDWLDTKGKGELAQYLTNIYSRTEPDLVKLAIAMAEDVFEGALDKEKLRSDLETVAEEADVPEEERKEAGGIYGGVEEPDAIPDSWKKISQAREADIKYRMKDGTTVYMDSTEMPIHEAGQHGIIKENIDGLDEAIKAAKTGGAEEMEALRQNVTTMFIKNIGVYNKTILDLVTSVEGKGKKGKGLASIKKILSSITKANKKRPKGQKPIDVRATVKQVAAATGVEMAKGSSAETALKYIIHTVVNLAGEANRNFRQGHFVGIIHQQRTYASVPMKLKNTTTGIPNFKTLDTAPDKAMSVLMLQGESHLLAFMEKDRHLGAAVQRETKARQIQAFQTGKIVGVGANGQTHGQAKASMDLRMSARPSTTVTFNPESMEDIMNLIPSLVEENTKDDKIKSGAQKFMSSNRGNRLVPEMNRLGHSGSTKFWALPYIGLMEYPIGPVVQD